MYLYFIFFVPLTAHDLLPGRPPPRSADDDGTDTIRRPATTNEEITHMYNVYLRHVYIYIIRRYITIPESYYIDSRIYTV
jgi:hypothetical protein